MKKFLLVLTFALFYGITQAQLTAPRNVNETEINSLRQDFQRLNQEKDYQPAIEKAIELSEALIQQERYKEAASVFYQMDNVISNSEEKGGKKNYLLRFLTASQRLHMFTRERKPESSKTQLGIMQYCITYLKNNDSVRDKLLLREAEYYRTFDMPDKSMERYKELLQRYTGRSNNETRESCYKDILGYAEHNKIAPLTQLVQEQYTAWQDSVKMVKAAQELEVLQKEHQTLQEDLTQKEKRISNNKLTIIGLWVFIVILVAALLALLFILFKKIFQARKYKNSLKIANESNEQKSHFISNITAHIAPSLDAIEDAITTSSSAALQKNITSLRKRIDDMQTYISLEETREEAYPVGNVDIKLLCDAIMLNAKAHFKAGVEDIVLVPRVGIKTNAEVLDVVLSHLLKRAAKHTESGKITLEFKKRNARTGQFIITDTGNSMDQEKQEDLFKPFAESDSVNNEDDWVLPICQLMAYKLNGTLKVDTEYKNGIRFILDLCS
jgi:Signal transduction histidine kinase